jgi:hypothetical protein
MTINKQDGGPAYPLQPASMPEMHYLGMSLRDYAVIQYTAAMLAHSTRYKPRDEDKDAHWHTAIAREANDLVDAMLAERNKQ